MGAISAILLGYGIGGFFGNFAGGFVVERLYDRIAGTTIGSFEGTISAPGP